jgi:hypothetical protein
MFNFASDNLIGNAVFPLFAIGALLTAGATDAHANTVVFATGPTRLGDRSINVSAQFELDPSNHHVTITLLNFQTDPVDVTQLLGSVRFTLSGAGATPIPLISQVGASTFDVDGNGNPVTDVAAPVWTAANIGSTQIALCTVCGNGGNKDLIIGGPNVNGRYVNANGSIAGNDGHNPFLIASGATYASGALYGLDTSPSWMLAIPSETASVAVSNVIFGFGTGTNYGTNFIQIENPASTSAPEPASLIGMGSGIGLLSIGLWKSRGRKG